MSNVFESPSVISRKGRPRAFRMAPSDATEQGPAVLPVKLEQPMFAGPVQAA
jgi:hypothetical protein